ncbi:uncharacterized protein PG998_013631 [Apiospora kogelbergensis]|uniref:uncharacterized protein n=1 Tax=Apiospora kogelbergensis TaxID=1337665 RepID=UPI00313134F4
MAISALLKNLEDRSRPTPWASVVEEDIKPLCRVLKQWQPVPDGSFSTQNIRLLVGSEFDRQVFDDFGSVPPPNAEFCEPGLEEMVKSYQRKVQGSKSRLSKHINGTWKTNITMIDLDWESKRSEFETPDMSMMPQMTANSLTSAFGQEHKRMLYKTGNIINAIVGYFIMIGAGFRRMEERLEVKIRIGEIADALEGIRYGLSPKSDSGGERGSNDRVKSPKRFNVTHMNNILGHTGGPPEIVPVRCIAVGNGPWDWFDGMRVEEHSPLIETHFHVKLSRNTPEGYSDAMYPLTTYYKWERVAAPSKAMEFGELMTQARLAKWLHSHFFKICLPYERGPAFDLVYAPLNLTVFMRLLVHVSELGYPAHWFSKVRVSVEPWKMEVAALVNLWQPLFPFGLVTTSTDSGKMLAPMDEINKYTVKFPPFFQAGEPPDDIRPLLLDDETGDKTASADYARSEVVRVVTTFKWSTDSRTATFWLREGDMTEMIRENWLLYVWRTDFWDRQSTSGLGLKDADNTSGPFGGDV